MAEPWRWIDNPDGTHVLVEGDDLLPLASTILMCGSVESSYQDKIAAVPVLIEALRGLLMVSLPGDVSGQRYVDEARAALRSALGA